MMNLNKTLKEPKTIEKEFGISTEISNKSS